MMKYITIKRAKFNSISGYVNIRFGEELICVDGILIYKENPICVSTSQNAYDFFAVNDDNRGLERGKLVQYIKNSLSKRDDLYQYRWDKIWSDKICKKYRRIDHPDVWIWNHDFYNADILDLQHIVNLIQSRS